MSMSNTPTTKTTKLVAGIYEVAVSDGRTFRIERTQDQHGQFTSEGWHLFQLFDNGTEDWWNVFSTKAYAIQTIKDYS